MRTLIIGATGLVGAALAAYLSESAGLQGEVIGVGSAQADIRDERTIGQLIGLHRPDWTVLAAAIADVDLCEREPERARAVNTVGPSYVARACLRTGSRLLFLSTDYVFDGNKTTPYETDDPVNPLSVYGRSKADGEEAVRTAMPDACIVRTSWVFGLTRPGVPGTILEQAERQAEVAVVSDQTSAPTYAPDLAAMLHTLMSAGARGTLHACGANGCTRLEWAQELLRLTGKTDVRLRAVSNADLNRPARRPRYSVLSTACLGHFGLRARPWQESVADYLVARARAMGSRGAHASE